MVKRRVRFLGVFSLAAALLSCGGGGGADEPTSPPPPTVDLNAVAAITVTAPTLNVTVGKPVLLSAQATNANGTVLTNQQFVWSTSSPSTATIEQNGTLLGVAPGQVNVAAAIGTRNGQVTLTVVPVPAAATIAINSGDGQTATINTAVATPPSVIVKDAAGDPVSGVTVLFAVGADGGSATGLTQVTNVAGIATLGSWTMGPNPGPQTLTATSGTLTGSPVTFTATAAALAANMRQYNTQTGFACSNPVLRTGLVVSETARLTIVADVGNPAGGFTASDYQAFATTFENLTWPVLTENFGVPADIDGGGRVVAFFTRAVNELTPAGSSSFVAGFFFGRDLFPKVTGNGFSGCPGSNQAEMFYLLAPDPTGVVNGNVRATDFVRRISSGTIGHEMQHLINSSRRLFINTNAKWPEVGYMEEGLAHIAEELLFYNASGLTPKSNISGATIQSTQTILDAANAYVVSNWGRFSTYLKAPPANAPIRANDGLATRGAIWSLLRYLGDRGSATAMSEPACESPMALSVNARCRIEGGAAASFAIDGGTGSEYTIVAFADGAALTTSATATNTVAVGGPPNPSRLSGGANMSRFDDLSIGGSAARIPLDMTFHTRLREIERHELTPRVPQARARFAKSHRAAARFSRAQAPERASFSAAIVEPVWGRLVNSNDTGTTNLRAEFGADLSGATRDWFVANYVDDALSGMPAPYTHPSWNFRSVLPLLSSNASAYPLQTLNLADSPVVTMINGGAAYFRLGIGASSSSAVAFTVNGAAPPSNLKLVVLRTK